MDTTGIVYHDDYLKHDTGSFHPEKAERLTATIRKLEEANLMEKMYKIEPVRASKEQIEYVHEDAYVRNVEALCNGGGGMLDLDTPVSESTYETALLSAGGAIKAVEEVISKKVRNAFALIRPPGHHSTSNKGMGFCIFNNIAIAAEHLKRKYGRKHVLIVDWDVHHGNGTQEIFFEEPSVLYFSTHQYPYYPGTGWIDEVGVGKGEGFTVNAPLPAGIDTDGYLYVMEEILMPIAKDFSPDFVLVSAGFDAHAADLLASMRLTSASFGLFTNIIKEIAEKSKSKGVVILLEGGYNLDALSESVLSVFNSLFGLNFGEREKKEEGKRISENVKKRVAEIKEVQRKYWNNL